MKKISIKELLDAGIHFGHRTNRWNPKMAEFIFGHRNGIHIIDLQQTLSYFNNALKIVEEAAKEKKICTFKKLQRDFEDLLCHHGGIGIRNRLKICRPFGIEGSSPSGGTKHYAPLAQLDRATAF